MTDREWNLARSQRSTNPWLAVGVTVLATVVGFFVVYRWPTGSPPRPGHSDAAAPADPSAPSASPSVNTEAMLASVRAQAATPPGRAARSDTPDAKQTGPAK